MVSGQCGRDSGLGPSRKQGHLRWVYCLKAVERNIGSMSITRKRWQELANLAAAFPEAVSGSLNDVADLLDSRLARCKAEMLRDLTNVFIRAISAFNNEIREDDAPPSDSF
jgi:hypothetical protein